MRRPEKGERCPRFHKKSPGTKPSLRTSLCSPKLLFLKLSELQHHEVTRLRREALQIPLAHSAGERWGLPK